ncbi:dihydroneopterin aldolase [Bowmanella dokdonensis]|uniref:7,8-dihydroneopterin aldolase n=1 Tax=Bowmanella dokdonensis TaxID=751969 RepID=A0A939DQ12_9ALTE|nr:dihydroneopterin aldolase [Bowmanella dokdonensis]MBN7826644.1 dihydroneopterin aldolase [Bowmanella dokdonensis]
MDKIYIEGLKVHSLIGVYEWERKAPRPLLIDLCLETDLGIAARTDDVNDTIDYAKVAGLLEKVALESDFELLEALTLAMLDALFRDFPVQAARLKMSKPDILPNASNVAVEISRRRS